MIEEVNSKKRGIQKVMSLYMKPGRASSSGSRHASAVSQYFYQLILFSLLMVISRSKRSYHALLSVPHGLIAAFESQFGFGMSVLLLSASVRLLTYPLLTRFHRHNRLIQKYKKELAYFEGQIKNYEQRNEEDRVKKTKEQLRNFKARRGITGIHIPLYFLVHSANLLLIMALADMTQHPAEFGQVDLPYLHLMNLHQPDRVITPFLLLFCCSFNTYANLKALKFWLADKQLLARLIKFYPPLMFFSAIALPAALTFYMSSYSLFTAVLINHINKEQ